MFESHENLRSRQVDIAVADYLEAQERGCAPDREAFLAEHPEIADALREFLDDYESVNRVMPGQQRDTSANVGRSTGGSRAIAPTLPVPRNFGAFELLEEIARGGMGVVYKARQKYPERIVALKMILAGQLASQADVERFSAEAHAAAALDHPGIVPVFEVGQHEGQHYFTMGFVAGQSLAQRLLDGPLPDREAAAIVAEVGAAVHYAHQRGVIHRDLKPANILLDDSGRVRVTDFGLAKRQTDGSGLTHTGQLLGTPSFMSPEQVSGNPAAIGPAADVYSLGATLYTLLTGRPPFQAASTIDTLKQVTDREPVPPREFDASIPRDLETIVLKALAKEPGSRYHTADEMAEDLRRFLADRPILARRSTARERFVRWCRRNPALASLTATAAIALIAGTVVSTWQAVRATRAEGIARDKQAEAEANYQKAKGAVDKYFTLVSESTLFEVPGLQPLRKELLEAALEFYESATLERTDDPAVLADLAVTRLRVAQVYRAAGRVDDAFPKIDLALDAIDQLRSGFPAHREYHRKLAGYWRGYRPTQSPAMPTDVQGAIGSIRRLRETWQALADENPDTLAFQSDLAAINFQTGVLLAHVPGQQTAGVAYLEECKVVQDTLAQKHPMVPEYRADLARTCEWLAVFLPEVGRTDEGQVACRMALSLREQLVAELPNNAQHKLDLAQTLGQFGVLVAATPSDAAKSFQRSLEIYESLVAEYPKTHVYRSHLADALWQMGNSAVAFGQRVEAEGFYRRALGICEELVKEVPRNARHQLDVATSCLLLGNFLRDNHQLHEAAELFRRAANLHVVLAADAPGDFAARDRASDCYMRLAQVLAATGDHRDAANAARCGVEFCETLIRDAPSGQDYRERLAAAQRFLAEQLAESGPNDD